MLLLMQIFVLAISAVLNRGKGSLKLQQFLVCLEFITEDSQGLHIFVQYIHLQVAIYTQS